MAILKTIWLSQNRGIQVGYILPTVEMVQKFVASKVNRMAQQNPVIQAAMKDKDSITQKQIGDSFIFYLGAQTERSAIMLSLDMLVADEYDKAPQSILETYDSRLQHSTFGYKWVFSNPTFPDFGVDRFWAMSDQKKWHIKHSCGKEYVMDESCVNYTTEQYQCPHCQNVITFEEIRMGEWYATAKGEWSGYWIPLWINPLVTAKTICDHKKTKTKEYFYNFVAGLPYVNANDALSLPALLKCLDKEVNERKGRTIIGVDTGHNIHYTMMNSQGFYYNGYCPSVEENKTRGYDPYDELRKLMREDKMAVMFADQGGDLIGIRKLQNEFPGRVFLVWFVKETRNQQIIRFGENEEYGRVLVDRNRLIQLLAVDQINEGRIAFQGTQEDWKPVFDHALNIYRVKEITGDENDPQYGWRWVWKRKGADHFFMAMCYALVGQQRFGQELAQIISKDKFMAGVSVGSEVDGNIQGKRFIRAVDVDF